MVCVTVSKINVTDYSDPCHLISQWGDEVKICLVHKDEYWEGVFFIKDKTYFADQLLLNQEKYGIKLKEALSTNSQDSNYIFDFQKCVLKWKIMSESDVSFIHGKCNLNDYYDKGGSQMLIDTLLNLNKSNEEKLRHQEFETLELGRQLRMCIENYKKLSEVKNEMETDLYAKFMQLLNAKKQRISDLQKFCFDVEPESGRSSDSVKIKLLDSDEKINKNIHPMSESDSND